MVSFAHSVVCRRKIALVRHVALVALVAVSSGVIKDTKVLRAPRAGGLAHLIIYLDVAAHHQGTFAASFGRAGFIAAIFAGMCFAFGVISVAMPIVESSDPVAYVAQEPESIIDFVAIGTNPMLLGIMLTQR